MSHETPIDVPNPATIFWVGGHRDFWLLRRGRDQYVVVDTAPTGHTLLLLDRTGSVDVYANLVTAFRNPLWTLFYVVAMVLSMFGVGMSFEP